MPDDARSRALEDADGIVFLCSGNMVRSAFADLYARHLECPTPVRSAATIYRNDRIFPETAVALRALGVAPAAIRAFRPVHIDDMIPTLSGGPVFLGMRYHHLDAMCEWPEYHARSFLLDPEHEIADPVAEDADFDETFARVAAKVEELVRTLRA